MGINRRRLANFITASLLFIISIFVIYCSISKIYHSQPITTDENAYIFEAKLLAKGRFYSRLPPAREFFRAEQMVLNDKWFSRYPPGHSLVLIPGVLLNFNHLMPIILSSFMIVIIYCFLLKLTKSLIVSAIAGIVTISSPFFIAVSGYCGSHSSFSFFIVLYLFVLYRNIEGKLKNNRLSFFLGLLWSFIFIIRQYSCLLATTPFVCYHLYLCLRYKCYKNLIYFALGSIPLIMLFFLYNYKCTGNPLLQTYSCYDPEEKLGFGLRYSGEYLFTPQEALKNLKNNIILLDKWLFGLPFPLLIILASVLFSRKTVWKMLSLCSILLLITGYFFFYFPGLGWIGPNYYYDIFPILVILFFWSLSYIYNKYLRKWHTICLALLIIAPAYIFYYPGFIKKMSKGILLRTQELVAFENIKKKNNIHNAIVFFQADYSIFSPPTIFINNSPFLDNDVLTVQDLEQANYSLMSLYPEREYYRLYFTGKEEGSSISEIYHQKSFSLNMEFDDNFSTLTGRRVPIGSTGKYILYAKKGVDKSGSLLYGPYKWFPGGEYKCVFYIRVDRIADNAPIAKIDVCTDSGTRVFAERILTGSDFHGNNIHKFILNFRLNTLTKLETRVYFYSNADLCIRKVRIAASGL